VIRWCEWDLVWSYFSLQSESSFSTLVWNGLSFDESVNTMLLFGVWKTDFFFISSLINIYPFPCKHWHVMASAWSVKALVLVGLWEVLASESLAQTMHSALVFSFPWCISFLHRPVCSKDALRLLYITLCCLALKKLYTSAWAQMLWISIYALF